MQLVRHQPLQSSLPAWGEWIEIRIDYESIQQPSVMSLPAWGEWIEIVLFDNSSSFPDVSPRMGRVD